MSDYNEMAEEHRRNTNAVFALGFATDDAMRRIQRLFGWDEPPLVTHEDRREARQRRGEGVNQDQCPE